MMSQLINDAVQQKIVDAVHEKFPDTDKPGCALMVYQNGQAVFDIYNGVREMKSLTPISSSTNFRMASVSKQFTAACILLLIQERMIGFNDRINKFFADFPAYGNSISIQNLLCHTSGLKDYEDFVPDEPEVFPKDKEVLEILKNQSEGDFGSGEFFKYSNSGYAVLAMIIEQVSRMSFSAFMKKHFFDKLGMENSRVHVESDPQSLVPNRAMGHVRNNDKELIEKDFSSTSFVLGDGGVYTSVEDYTKWLAGLDNATVLNESTVRSIYRPQSDNSGRDIPYGFGWRLNETKSGWQPFHPGGTTGFNNCVRRRLDHNFTVAVFGNISQWGAVDFATGIESAIAESIES